MPKLYQITKKVSGLAKGTRIGFYIFLCLALKLRDDPTYLVPLSLSMGKESKERNSDVWSTCPDQVLCWVINTTYVVL